MKIEEIKLCELKPYENNPRVNDDAAARLQDSIRNFGFSVPILVDKDNVIVCGHTRYKAAKALGMKSVPCIRTEWLSEEQVRAFRIADNKYGELSHWDTDLLKSELSFLKDIDFDVESLGFNPYELQSYLEPFTFEFGTDDESKPDSDESLFCENENKKHEFPEYGRIIITYDSDDEFEYIKKTLHLDGDKKKVTYRAGELMKTGGCDD